MHTVYINYFLIKNSTKHLLLSRQKFQSETHFIRCDSITNAIRITENWEWRRQGKYKMIKEAENKQAYIFL